MTQTRTWTTVEVGETTRLEARVQISTTGRKPGILGYVELISGDHTQVHHLAPLTREGCHRLAGVCAELCEKWDGEHAKLAEGGDDAEAEAGRPLGETGCRASCAARAPGAMCEPAIRARLSLLPELTTSLRELVNLVHADWLVVNVECKSELEQIDATLKEACALLARVDGGLSHG